MSSTVVSRIFAVIVGLVALAAAFFLGVKLDAGGHTTGSDAGSTPARRDFLFQVTGVPTANQGGATLDLLFHYRYKSGIADNDIPDYTKVRKTALDYLAGADVQRNPYWETLNHGMCLAISSQFPVDGISCEIQVVSHPSSGKFYEPGFHASIETIGNIDPLTAARPLTVS